MLLDTSSVLFILNFVQWNVDFALIFMYIFFNMFQPRQRKEKKKKDPSEKGKKGIEIFISIKHIC